MNKKYGTFSSELLRLIGDATGFFTWPLEYSQSWRLQQLKNYKSKRIYDNLYHLKTNGLTREISKKGRKFIELTKKGEMEMLFTKARLKNEHASPWDGKWRLVIFDIPEDAKSKRDKLRKLLKEMGFTMLQASVFISPQPLNHAAVEYLKQSGLIDYIRLARIDELDYDKDLKNKFKLV